MCSSSAKNVSSSGVRLGSSVLGSAIVWVMWISVAHEREEWKRVMELPDASTESNPLAAMAGWLDRESHADLVGV
jgi:hypothetical protein